MLNFEDITIIKLSRIFKAIILTWEAFTGKKASIMLKQCLPLL